MDLQERRRTDRRIHMRGGRRFGDRPAYGPRVFVVTREPAQLRFWEALLLKLKFAVVPCDGAESALEASRALPPDVMVVSKQDFAITRDRCQESAVPLVELVGTPDLVEPVVSAIRRALHSAQKASSRHPGHREERPT